ncbi:hypothetical protein Syun_027413 [Stephania yunnanensis]|uniref:Uncharacterized protein n=1 Tax=Stephania yunnanensis TaxID=152371 RepID=A0AAP0HPY0_9MAGN
MSINKTFLVIICSFNTISFFSLLITVLAVLAVLLCLIKCIHSLVNILHPHYIYLVMQHLSLVCRWSKIYEETNENFNS